LYVEPVGAAEPTVIADEPALSEYQLSEDGSTVVYMTVTHTVTSNGTTRVNTLYSYDVATRTDTTVSSWSGEGSVGTLFPLWLEYLGPNGQTAIFGFCRLVSEGAYAAQTCGENEVRGSWAGEGIMSLSNPVSPELLPTSPSYPDDPDTGLPATFVAAAASDGTLILIQWTKVDLGPPGASNPDAEFVYQPGTGISLFPTVNGKICLYEDAYGGGTGLSDEGQFTDTTNGISPNGRYVVCSVENGSHDSSAYVMDLATGQATLVQGNTYEVALPEWISPDGTEVIFYGEPLGGGGNDGGNEALLQWVSPTKPLP
jgi:hypothetical protein